MTSLRDRTLSGLRWKLLNQIAKQAIQFCITLILLRLLSPADYGLLGMAVVVTGFASIFSEMGLISVIIQKPDLNDRHLSSAFWLNLLIGLLLSSTLILAAPLVALFYGIQELRRIVSILALNFIVASLATTQIGILMRKMDFRSLAIRETIALLISGAVGITLALRGFGVWSLVAQSLASSIVGTILLWSLSSWRPSLLFSLTALKEILGFSSKVAGFNVVNYFGRNTDCLLIGKFIGASALGYYSLAYKIMLFPLQNLTSVISSVMFPAFSKMQSDMPRVRRTYLCLVKSISLISFPLMTCFICLAPEFVHIFLGAKWAPAIIIIRILAICGMFQSIISSTGDIIMSQGKPGMQLAIGTINAFLVALAVSLGLLGGLTIVALSYAIASTSCGFYAQHLANRLIHLKIKDFLPAFLNSFLISLILLASITLFKQIIPVQSIPTFILYVACITTVFILGLVVTGEIRVEGYRIRLVVISNTFSAPHQS